VANEEHVKRLEQGVAEWNAWRAEQADRYGLPNDVDLTEAVLRRADLRGANLYMADLTGADLAGANLQDAYLSYAPGVDLTGANLREANLTDINLTDAVLIGTELHSAELLGADLTRANLQRANLQRAYLSTAILRAADLEGANLRHADLTDADLHGANLTNAKLMETIFGNVDLSSVTGLEACDHRGPSVVDYRTLQKSGRLPLSFLRGVGLPDKLIDYLPSIFDQAIQYYSCFISYSSRDQDFADRIHADLQNKGVRCWFAPHDMPIGGKIRDEIDAAIRLRDKVLLILSKHSIKSDWVEDEVTKAFAEERRRGQTVLFPVRLDEVVMDTGEAWAVKLRDQRNIGDFRRWKDHDRYRRGFERVLRDLKQLPESEK
jgi:uncharacterized protein YjbI with pentapeptide repeats